MSPSVTLALLSGTSLAFASSAHCALMCGPLAMASTGRRSGAQGRYFVGRLVSYTLLGALSGSAGRTVISLVPARFVETAVLWSLAVSLAFAAVPLLGLVRARRESQPTIPLRRSAPRRPLTRLLAQLAGDPLLLGVATALLPCGALYAVLAGAAALADPLAGALMMATFATISGLALLGLASLSTKLLSLGAGARRLLGAALLAGACVLLVRPIPLLRGETKPALCGHCHGATP
jgi:uncharacterized protein